MRRRLWHSRAILFSALTGLMCGLAVSSAEAACEARIERARDALLLGGGYDGFAFTEIIEAFPLDIRHVDGDACRLILTFVSKGNDERFLIGAGGELRYAVQRSTRVSDVIPNSASALETDLIALSLEPGGEQRITFFLRIPAEQIVRSGNYRDQIELGLFELNGIAREIRDERAIEVSTDVRSHFEINITGGSGGVSGVGASALVDFGILRTGVERQVFIQTRSSDNYALGISSEYGGKLRHEAIGGSSITYNATLDRSAVSFAGPSLPTRLTRPGPTSLRGDSLTLSLEIGEVSKKPAGKYRDTVTIEIQPN